MPFPPQEIPVDKDGFVVNEGPDAFCHYACIVWVVSQKRFAIFEFGQDVMDSLTAYRLRSKKISDMELIVSRTENGKLRVLSSKPNNLSFEDNKEESYKNSKILEKYLSLTTPYKVNN